MDIEEQIEDAYEVVARLLDARIDLRYGLEKARKLFLDAEGEDYATLSVQADDALSDLDMDQRLQALIDGAEELADKLEMLAPYDEEQPDD